MIVDPDAELQVELEMHELGQSLKYRREKRCHDWAPIAAAVAREPNPIRRQRFQ